MLDEKYLCLHLPISNRSKGFGIMTNGIARSDRPIIDGNHNSLIQKTTILRRFDSNFGNTAIDWIEEKLYVKMKQNKDAILT